MSVLIIANEKQVKQIVEFICKNYNEKVVTQIVNDSYLLAQTESYEIVGVYPENSKNPIEQGENLLQGKIELVIVDRDNPATQHLENFDNTLKGFRTINKNHLLYFS